ncbi:glycosyltransferase family 4 protein [Polynucleobacter sp. HIN7]|uniref:glycosyltransferase family 4 protein n=1 Tax=Polynucleobacter sp. HIN7 TaxID=3047866 RepID=UPI002573C81D|nr:glycosyltransferase family 1 protein [Polynucleobacter sp. HIN7]BEI36579.1 glycosyltransferase family 1 protein [Polynucleobacter sp. HIN7]
MRIAFDDHIFSWQKYGGISRYFYELANQLTLEPSLDVKVISPFHVNEYLATSSKVPILGTKMPSGKYLQKGYRIANRLLVPIYQRGFMPNIIHETYYSAWGSFAGNAKRVITVHDMIHEKLPNYFHPKDKTPKRKAAAIERADHIICVSENTRADLIQILGVPHKKTSVVHHGLSFYREELARSNSSGAPPFLLYVGERTGYKNFSALLSVYAKYKYLHNNFHLIVFGGGHFSDLELQKIKTLKLDLSRVRQTTGNDLILRELYNAASLFIYPSQYEGFGIPPLEAMSMGCPVACSNTGSLPEVVGDAASFFDPNCEESMANAILCCLENQSYRDSLIHKGQARVKNYSWQKCAKETKAVYKALLS